MIWRLMDWNCAEPVRAQRRGTERRKGQWQAIEAEVLSRCAKGVMRRGQRGEEHWGGGGCDVTWSRGRGVKPRGLALPEPSLSRVLCVATLHEQLLPVARELHAAAAHHVTQLTALQHTTHTFWNKHRLMQEGGTEICKMAEGRRERENEERKVLRRERDLVEVPELVTAHSMALPDEHLAAARVVKTGVVPPHLRRLWEHPVLHTTFTCKNILNSYMYLFSIFIFFIEFISNS